MLSVAECVVMLTVGCDNMSKFIKRLTRKLSADSHYYHEDGEPWCCWNCRSTHISIENTDLCEHVVCEREASCMACGEFLNHWAYGYWDDTNVTWRWVFKGEQ